MSETKPEKSTKHYMTIRLLSDSPITYDAAVFTLAANIDIEELKDSGLIILGYDFMDSGPGTHTKKESGPSRLAEWAARSPGALGNLLTFIKGTSARNLYIGFCGFVLLAILLSKWVMRLVTGTF